MKELLDILYDNLNEMLDQIVISKPGKKSVQTEDGADSNRAGLDAPNRSLDVGILPKDRILEAEKCKIRPIRIGEKLFFQESAFVGTQVFHQNFEKSEMAQRIVCLMQLRFGQLQLESQTMSVTALVSKKGKVTIKTKKKQNTGKCKERELSHNRTKRYILPEGTTVPFLVDLGVQTKDGKIIKSRYDKFRQINRFLEFVEDVLPALPKGRRITILDFGCGKSYLTFAMYYYLKEKQGYDIEMIGLDLKKDVIDNCNNLAKKYGYSELIFLQGDVKDYQGKTEVDMVVTLHACDTATDIAIARAIAWNARVILSVPCCQHELNAQIKCDSLEPVLRYGLLKEKVAALLTDGIRACTMEAYGYETQVLEFIDMEHTPKNILLRGIRTNGMKKRGITMEKVKAMMDMLHTGQTLVSLLETQHKE